MSEASKPKPLFFVALAIVILGLVAYGFRSVIFPKSATEKPQEITLNELSGQGRRGPGLERADHRQGIHLQAF